MSAAAWLAHYDCHFLITTIGVAVILTVLGLFDLFRIGGVDDICRIINLNELSVQIGSGGGFAEQDAMSVHATTSMYRVRRTYTAEGGTVYWEDERLTGSFQIDKRFGDLRFSYVFR
jgi:hypothetical protein